MLTLRAEARWERSERAIPALLPLALKGLEFQIGHQNGSSAGAAAELVAAD